MAIDFKWKHTNHGTGQQFKISAADIYRSGISQIILHQVYPNFFFQLVKVEILMTFGHKLDLLFGVYIKQTQKAINDTEVTHGKQKTVP